jgi:hypothetical protein
MIWSGWHECRLLGNASLLNAMVGKIDRNLNGIVIRCAQSRGGSDEATTATA